jgi:DNA-binding HxlR family transcriptional regulator
MSPSVLYERLRELTEAGLVTRNGGQHYELTETGRALGAALDPLNRWAQRWANQISASGQSSSS